MNISIENNKLNISLSGKVDASNAPKVEEEIFAVIQNNELTSVEFDLNGLEYISSAGLRIILKILKICKDITANNVNSEVYDILEMTGFSEMIKVNKAYRVVDVTGCEVIGKGANGLVYKIDNETVIKTYLNPESLADIKRERELAKTALVLGIPTAISYDVVRVGEGYGSIFELLSAASFSKLLAAEDEHFDDYIASYVGIAKTMHSRTSNHPMLGDAKEAYMKKLHGIKGHIDEVRYEKLEKMSYDIPEEDTLLHGDYHIKNVMMQNDEVLLIDMDTLSHGNIIFEFTGIYNAYVGYNYRDKEDKFFLGLSNKQCERVYWAFLNKYFEGKSKEEIEKIHNKIAVTGLTKLLYNAIRDEAKYGKENIVMYTNLLVDAIDKVDDLII